MNPIITLPQDSDTPARREITPGAVFTYLCDRSRDSRQNNTPGQDFIAYSYTPDRIAFAVCDGVSQSFYGDLAARFLGEHLTAWLIGLDATLLTSFDFGLALGERLSAWVAEATALVEAKLINPDLPPMVRDALDKKRVNGSESMFVAGLVDRTTGQFAACWMGDMRLWLFDASGNAVDLPGAAWETRERWSTRLGPKNGAPRTAVLPLEGITRMIVHSDGIGAHASRLSVISLEDLDALARDLSGEPTSDDISVLDIALQPAAPADATPLDVPEPTQPDPRESVIRWPAVAGAGWYRVEITQADKGGGAQAVRSVEVTSPVYFVPRSLYTEGGTLLCRVQALASNRLVGALSAPLAVSTVPISAPGPAVAPVAAPGPVTSAAPERARPAQVTPPDIFRFRVLMALSLGIALVLSAVWYAMNLVR